MKTDNRFFFRLLPLLTALVTGCASVPMASPDEDAKAKSFAVQADKSNIYMYRNEFFGNAVAMAVELDSKLAGQTAHHTYFLFEVSPGPHQVSSVAENTSTVQLTTVGGKAYFVWQEVKMGMWNAGTQLHEVDEETGRKGVSECQRVKANF